MIKRVIGKITGIMGTININGQTVTGSQIQIGGNGNVMIDGNKIQMSENIVLKISIEGSCNGIDVSAGDVEVKGNVTGNVSTDAGDISCGDVQGSVKSGCGDITCGNIGGDAKTSCGDITCRKS